MSDDSIRGTGVKNYARKIDPVKLLENIGVKSSQYEQSGEKFFLDEFAYRKVVLVTGVDHFLIEGVKAFQRWGFWWIRRGFDVDGN
jgi:hypothetical protein